MDSLVFAAVLFAAACHAAWNAVIKLGLDALTTTALIALAGGLIALVLVPVVGVPVVEAWPWLIASAVLHLGYYIGLIEAYRAGDMGQVYPIARGSAPLMTAVASTALIGERIAAGAWLGIVALACGVLLLSVRGGRTLGVVERRAVGFALFTAVTICGYSLVDGVGARTSRDPVAYTVWLFLLDGIVMLVYALIRRGPMLAVAVRAHWRSGLIGGGLSFLAYGIAIWAMTVAPIAIVATLRETSVLFGAVIAVIFLKEPLHAVRVIAALMIVAGLALIRLS